MTKLALSQMEKSRPASSPAHPWDTDEAFQHFPTRQGVTQERLRLVFETLLRRNYPFWLENPGMFGRHASLLYELFERTEEKIERRGDVRGEVGHISSGKGELSSEDGTGLDTKF